MSSTRTPDPTPGWLSDEELAEIRHRLPLLYVEAVPVRLDGMGEVTEVGLLLRVSNEGAITRALVSGRVMFGENFAGCALSPSGKRFRPYGLPQLPPSPNARPRCRVFPFPRFLSIRTLASTQCR